MKANQAITQLQAQQWADTTALEKLTLLKKVIENIKIYGHELAESDTQMKNALLEEHLFSEQESLAATVMPVATTVSACIDLYTALVKGKMLQPIAIKKVTEDLYDIHVFPQNHKDKIIYADRKDFLRVKGEPKQINPLTKPAGIIAILGAGNYSSALEVINALFLENCAVVHKPHALNQATDKIWEKIMQPLVEKKALAFCEAEDGQALTQDKRISKIYFTGGAKTAQIIMQNTETEVISECGGNNPCLIVPGDKPWTTKEIQHQAIQIATMAKLNGGAVCGRPQTIVTSKHWPQRQAFLQALKQAITEKTPAAGSYYPNSDKVMQTFQTQHPKAEVLKPEQGKYKHSHFLMITAVHEEDYAIHNEAFCQAINEIALDTASNAKDFLPTAVSFCNEKLLGTLASTILIDKTTQKNHQQALEQAITDLKYGAITINTMPPFVFLNPYLTWGGNEEGETLVSGRGHFGNLLCFEKVEKSIMYADFISPGHMLNTNKKVMANLSKNMADYAVTPSWGNVLKMFVSAIVGQFKGKDF